MRTILLLTVTTTIIAVSQACAQGSSSGSSNFNGSEQLSNDFGGGAEEGVRPPTTSIDYNKNFIQSVEDRMWADIGGFHNTKDSVDPFLSKMYVWEEITREELKRFSGSELEVLWSTLEKWNTMVGWTEQLKEGMLDDETIDNGKVHEIMDDTINQALTTTGAVIGVVNALEGAERSDDRTMANRGITRTSSQPVRAFVPAASRVAYAGGFSDVSLQASYSYADIEDDVAGDGYDSEAGFTASGWLTDNLELGISIFHTQFDLGGPTDLERSTESIDIFATWAITDRLSLGFFVNHSYTDIEDSLLVDPLLGPIQLADTYSRWGAGVSVTASTEAFGFDWGVTTSIASTDNRALDDIFDHHNCAWLTLFDVQKSWTDSVSTMLYATYYTTVTTVTPDDNDFWMVGGEVSLAISDTFSVGPRFSP
jgi:hypothetical protein